MQQSPDLAQLGEILETCKQIAALCRSASLWLLLTGRDAVEEVFNCAAGVAEGSSKCSRTFLSREAHGHEVVDVFFVRHRRGLLDVFLLWLGLGGLLLASGLRLRFGSVFNFGLGRGFLC